MVFQGWFSLGFLDLFIGFIEASPPVVVHFRARRIGVGMHRWETAGYIVFNTTSDVYMLPLLNERIEKPRYTYAIVHIAYDALLKTP